MQILEARKFYPLSNFTAAANKLRHVKFYENLTAAKAGIYNLSNFIRSYESLKKLENFVIIYIESEERKSSHRKIKNYGLRPTARKVTTMTKREFLDAVINKNLSDETTAFATKELAQIDAGLEKRRNTLTPKQEENLKIVEVLVAELSDEPMTATMVYNLGIDGVTSIQKANSLLGMAAREGLANVVEVAVKGKGKQKGYVKA